MLNAGPQGGWGANATVTPPNPFNAATPPPPRNPFAKPPPNPFLESNKINAQVPLNNPFVASTTIANPFSLALSASLKRSASPSFNTTKSAVSARNPFEPVIREVSAQGLQPPKPSTTVRQSSPGQLSNGSSKVAAFVQPAWPDESNTPTMPVLNSAHSKKWTSGLNGQGSGRNAHSSSAPRAIAGKGSLAPENGLNGHSTVSPSAPKHSDTHDGRSHQLATKIQQQLSKDRIKPPHWPTNPGSHAQRQAMENFRESYKLYREKARKSLIKAGLIDDPEQKRTLQQALDFRGISEDMCPEWEKITRIIEYDVRNPEKAHDDSGDLVAIPSLMVKRLARSAAGQDAPLPMDVRSFATLRKTLDYLIDDLIPEDNLLPSKHNFLWDRTRAIRIDLSVQKYNLTPDERTDLVYCLETIARFHVTALHLLSQDGFAAEDFSEQQEIEQLGKTLISLKELYDDCAQQEIECPNEAEFRGYYIVFNARNPSIKEAVEGWSTRLWNSDGIRTAMCLVESLQNTWSLQGPLNPYAPTELALGAAAIFFSIVSSPQISYTMACFAEIHFNDVRKSILQVIRKSYTRPRDGPKDITPAFLKERMRFDTEDEAVDFAQKHGIVFGQDGAHRYAILNSRQSIEDPRIRHAFSRDIVEHKRSGRSLPDIIHQTVYQDHKDKSPSTSQGESLFVADVESSDTSDSFTQDSETDSFDSHIPSSSPSTINAQSPLQPRVAITSSSKINQSTPPLKPPTTTTPLFATSAPTWVLNHKTPSSPFKQPHASLSNLKSDTTIQSNERGPLDANASIPNQNIKGGVTSDNNKFTTSSSETSPSIFSFLNPNNKGLSTASTSSSKPSLFSDINTGGNSPKAAIKPIDTVSSSPLPSSSPPTYTQSHDISSGRPLFENWSSTAHPSTTGSVLGPNFSTFSPKVKSSVSFTKQDTNSNKSVPTTGMLSPLPRLEPGKSNYSQSTPSATTSTAMVPKHDPMGDFTRWFVLADKGLMEEELEALAVKHILRATWENFQAAEEDRVRREEDEKSWEQALEFRRYSLKITFFYRWRDIIRKRRVIKRIRLEKEKARKWNSPQHKIERETAERVKREKAVEEAKELVGKRTREHAQEMTRMRESTQSHQSLEEALLATGVFSGVRDESAAARHAVRDDDVDSDCDMLPAEKLRLRSENQRRRKRGLPPLKRFPESKACKEGSKTAMLRAISSGTGRDSLSMSTSSLRNSTFSSSYRSSLGFNPSRVAKSRPNISDPYWRMKANGLVLMPNGEYLHETLALPMLREGKRYPGLGDYGLPPDESFTPSQSPPTGLNVDPDSVSLTPVRFLGSYRASRSPSINDGVTQKRKRGQAEDDDLTAYRNEASASRKRARSNDRDTSTAPSGDQDFLDSIANLLNKVNAITKSSTS
ncbi:hypothetical protein GGR58DRAFT_484697 [Xylaria digitata]|nr:hypothetical protein GGR58DRAFT_484697 [Xylaria digitata]